MATVANAVTPVVIASVDSLLQSPIAQRFPVPPSAFGFMADIAEGWGIVGLSSPQFIASALQPEGVYSEPTTGQIWPRLG